LAFQKHIFLTLDLSPWVHNLHLGAKGFRGCTIPSLSISCRIDPSNWSLSLRSADIFKVNFHFLARFGH
jgi:hypothetical protein